MPRPRKHILPLSELDCFEEIRSELQSKPELDDFDIDSAVITLKQHKTPYSAKPGNLEKAFASLKRYISQNSITAPIELSKREEYSHLY